MKSIESAYPCESRWAYSRRIGRSLLPILAFDRPMINQVVRLANSIAGNEYTNWIISIARAFGPTDPKFFDKIRKRPSTANIALLLSRVRDFNVVKLIEQRQAMIEIQDKFIAQDILVPGYKESNRDYWLFPLIVPEA